MALKAWGEVSSEGFFGVGAMKPTEADSMNKIRFINSTVMRGMPGTNVFIANEALPMQLKKLPYLW